MPTLECADKTTGQAVLLGFFGLQEQPYGVTPDPRFLYMTASHREALASLVYAIETKRGFSALVAEPGMGKTSLLFHILDKIKSNARTAFLFRPDGNSRDLLQSLLLDLGLDARPDDVPQMHEMLNSVLLEDLNAGRHFVWVIDEAQDLDTEVLESVRLLSNFETPVSKLMHIVLAGQPGLAEKLASPELLQLRQRVSTLAQLEPLSTRETSDYIQLRARRAGCGNPNLFAPESRTLIARASCGIPRNINNICFSCLSMAFAEGHREIDPGIVRKVLEDRTFETGKPAAAEQTSNASPSPGPARPIELPDLPSQYDFFEPPQRRSSLWTSVALVGFFVVPLLLVVLESNSRAGVLETFLGPAAEQILSRITGYDAHMPELPPIQAPALQPPKVPVPLPISETETQQPSELPPDENLVGTDPQPSSSAEHSGARPSTQTGSSTTPAGPRIVYTHGGENLFELALEYYGKSNWTIVTRIRSENPQIRDSFTVFGERQRVVLPDLAPAYPWRTHSKSEKYAKSSH